MLRIGGLIIDFFFKKKVTVFVLHNNSQQTPFYVNVDECALYTLPDTAVQRNGKPLFVPDFAVPCALNAHVAIRISRLGRSVSERFARRYWDAVSLSAHFVAIPLLEQAQREGLPWSTATGFDSAVHIGDFLSKDTLFTTEKQLAFRMTTSSGQQLLGIIPDVEAVASAAISRISRFYMIRNGDIILLPATSPGCEAVIGTRIEGLISDIQVLGFNVK
ncbi:MAG: fumarylacetoacetate hydrolase family protein [Alloprevotella sp.]